MTILFSLCTFICGNGAVNNNFCFSDKYYCREIKLFRKKCMSVTENMLQLHSTCVTTMGYEIRSDTDNIMK